MVGHLLFILLPNKKPIFAATYIPKEDRGRMAGLKNILSFLSKKYKNEPKELIESADSIEEAFKSMQDSKIPPIKLDLKIIDTFIENINKSFDKVNKGIGTQPKFPHASTFDVLLDIYNITKNKKALSLASQTLEAMGKGGIYDQIEGGFYRYSVDEKWQVPHFEKMLYTNAELICAYSKLYAITKEEKYKQIVEETIKAINERFYHKGLYFSASDADSQGEEGKYFVFDYDKIRAFLLKEGFSKEETKEILKYFNIDEFGNFEEYQTNPYLSSNIPPKKIKEAKIALKKLRSKVPYPFIDNKILTSWNALFITSLFEAGENIDKKYLKMAFKSLDKLIETSYKNGILYHQYLFSSTLKIRAILEDYAFLSEALLKAYEISENKKYLDLAKTFINTALRDFYKNGDWYLGYFPAKAELEDNAYKSAMATILKDMASLALFTDDIKIFENLSFILKEHSSNLLSYPQAYPSALYVYLQMQKKEILLKVPQDKKEEAIKEVKKINYPFIHVLSHNAKTYQACQIGLCFANEKTLEKVLEKIKTVY